MAEVIDIQKICRACLVDTGPFTSLLSLSVPESLLFSEIYKYCTSVAVSDTDRLPKQMCVTCAELLTKLYNFKQMALKSNVILKQHLNQPSSNNDVKIEYNHSVDEASTDSNGANYDQSSSSEDKVPEEIQVKPDIRLRRKRKIDDALILKSRSRMQCPKCVRSFQKYENFEAHLRSHFGKKPDIKCDICEKSFPNLRNLASHSRSHGGAGVRKYQCLTCGKRFAYLNVLKTHELIHAGVKKHTCHLCDAKFVQRSNLKSHLETHKKEKNYICVQCGKKFSQAGNLKTHLIRHTGIKDIACSVCDMRFYIKSDLFKHMRSHSSDKPYSCEYCDKSFKTKSFKVVHMRTHTGERPYICDLCPKSFMAQKDMRNHRMIHTGEKPHKCRLCSQAFIQKCALNRHMKSHNKNDDGHTHTHTAQIVRTQGNDQTTHYINLRDVNALFT